MRILVLVKDVPDTYADRRFLYSTAKGAVTSLFSASDPDLPNGTPVDKAIETIRALIKSGDR